MQIFLLNNMPSLTFYAYIGRRHRREAIKTIRDWPTDWQHLKGLLAEAAEKVHIDHKQRMTIMTLELHLGGKYIMRSESYTPRKVHVNREPEFRARISWNPKTREALVDQGVFGPFLYFLAPDYYAERGIRWRVPPVVPKQQFAVGDAKALLMEPSGLRYVDYHREPANLYGRGAEKHVKHLNYLPFDTREYLPDKFKLREEFLDKREQSP